MHRGSQIVHINTVFIGITIIVQYINCNGIIFIGCHRIIHCDGRVIGINNGDVHSGRVITGIAIIYFIKETICSRKTRIGCISNRTIVIVYGSSIYRIPYRRHHKCITIGIAIIGQYVNRNGRSLIGRSSIIDCRRCLVVGRGFVMDNYCLVPRKTVTVRGQHILTINCKNTGTSCSSWEIASIPGYCSGISRKACNFQ